MAPSVVSSGNEELETTNDTWTTLFGYAVENGHTVLVDIAVVARRPGNVNCAAWRVAGLFRRDGDGSLVQVGAETPLLTPFKTLGALLWDVRLALGSGDDINKILVQVKGAASDAVIWCSDGPLLALREV